MKAVHDPVIGGAIQAPLPAPNHITRLAPPVEKKVVVSGRFPRTARLQSEYYIPLEDPIEFMNSVQKAGLRADVFTFVQGLDEITPKYAFHRETDNVAVLRISTYEHWFEKQLYFKPRNKLRKSQKAGVEARVLEFDDELVRAIKDVYDETPTRQGKPNKHYKKDLETLRREHSTFLDCSQFVGVFYKDEMIGFAKITHTGNYSVLMNIVSKICHRDKAPTNALIAKSVALCAEKESKYLMYGVWGGQGLIDFKEANGFECFEVPRYFVALTWRGKLALKLGLHRRLADLLPPRVARFAMDVRSRLIALRSKRPAIAQN